MKRLIKNSLWQNKTKEVFNESGVGKKQTYPVPRPEDILTGEQEGYISLDDVKDIPGWQNEHLNMHWREIDGYKYFGGYIEENWKRFVEDIKDRGIEYPIRIIVEANGKPFIIEGNHRLWAAKELGLKYVPVIIAYYGNSQRILKF